MGIRWYNREGTHGTYFQTAGSYRDETDVLFVIFCGKIATLRFCVLFTVIAGRILASDVNVSLVFSYIYVQGGKYYSENTICGFE
jgi:hypothetical protein